MTHETFRPSTNSLVLRVQPSTVQTQPAALLGVDVTGNSLMTTSTQLQPKTAISDDDGTIAQDNFTTHTNRLRLRVQVQLFQPAATLVEEGISELTPSSFEIHFPGEPR